MQEIRSFETLCAAFWRELFYDRLSFTRIEMIHALCVQEITKSLFIFQHTGHFDFCIVRIVNYARRRKCRNIQIMATWDEKMYEIIFKGNQLALCWVNQWCVSLREVYDAIKCELQRISYGQKEMHGIQNKLCTVTKCNVW